MKKVELFWFEKEDGWKHAEKEKKKVEVKHLAHKRKFEIHYDRIKLKASADLFYLISLINGIGDCLSILADSYICNQKNEIAIEASELRHWLIGVEKDLSDMWVSDYEDAVNFVNRVIEVNEELEKKLSEYKNEMKMIFKIYKRDKLLDGRVYYLNNYDLAKSLLNEKFEKIQLKWK